MNSRREAHSPAETPALCPALLTIEDLSARLHVPKGTIYNWVHHRKIPFVKVGRLLRFDPAEIAKYLDGCRIGPLAGKG